MNNDDNNRFNKLYELLGDKVNQIFEDRPIDIFTPNNNNVFYDPENQPGKGKNIINKQNPVGDNVRNVTEIYRKDYEDDFTDMYNIDRLYLSDILTNRKFLMAVSVLAFIAVCVVVGKAFYYGKKTREYEQIIVDIDKKKETYVKIDEGEEIDTEIIKDVAASELISCINQKVEIDKLSDKVRGVINEINTYYNSSSDYFAYVYKDIYTGFTVSYNASQNIFTASAIKAPTDIYIYEAASQGKIDLDEEMTYTAGYVNDGSGLLKYEPVGGKYTVRKLLEYSTVDSDNAAHNMLMDHFGRENMLSFWSKKGTTSIFTANNNWGILNANDSAIYMSELYNFYVSNKEYGEPLMNNFLNSYPKFIKGNGNYGIASKSGWSGTALHDVAIVFADNPYIVVALSNLGTTGYYESYFNRVSELSAKLHTEYWKYKMSTCNEIKQY